MIYAALIVLQHKPLEGFFEAEFYHAIYTFIGSHTIYMYVQLDCLWVKDSFSWFGAKYKL